MGSTVCLKGPETVGTPDAEASVGKDQNVLGKSVRPQVQLYPFRKAAVAGKYKQLIEGVWAAVSFRGTQQQVQLAIKAAQARNPELVGILRQGQGTRLFKAEFAIFQLIRNGSQGETAVLLPGGI